MLTNAYGYLEAVCIENVNKAYRKGGLGIEGVRRGYSDTRAALAFSNRNQLDIIEKTEKS